MPADLLDQLSCLGDALGRLTPPVTLDEITGETIDVPSIEHREPGPELVLVGEPQPFLPRSGAGRSWRIVGGIAAAMVLAIAALSLWQRRSSPTTTSNPPVAAATSTTIPGTQPASVDPRLVPSGSTVRFTEELAGIGMIEVFDTADRNQVCFVLTTPTGMGNSCDDAASIAAGRSWGLFKLGDVPLVLLGISATDVGLTVTAGGHQASPDTNGLWYLTVPATMTEFTMTTKDGTTVVPVAAISSTATTFAGTTEPATPPEPATLPTSTIGAEQGTDGRLTILGGGTVVIVDASGGPTGSSGAARLVKMQLNATIGVTITISAPVTPQPHTYVAASDGSVANYLAGALAVTDIRTDEAAAYTLGPLPPGTIAVIVLGQDYDQRHPSVQTTSPHPASAP